MTFHSILWDRQDEVTEEPEFFADLNLDQVIDAITMQKREYNLAPFFHNSLPENRTIYYRHEVMQDLGDRKLMTCIQAFAEKMSRVRRYLELVEKLDFTYHKEGWFLEAALLYCDTVTGLAHNLSKTNMRSRGLLSFCAYTKNYINSQVFKTFQKETQQVKIFYVTHLFDFAHSFYEKNREDAIFLRAERREGGYRTYKLIEGEPLETSFGMDAYQKIFGEWI